MGRHRKTGTRNPLRILFGATALGTIAAGFTTGVAGDLPVYVDHPTADAPPIQEVADLQPTATPLLSEAILQQITLPPMPTFTTTPPPPPTITIQPRSTPATTAKPPPPPKPEIVPPKPKPTTASGIIGVARSWLGRNIPYLFGGSSLRGMDCSHFVWEVLKQAGYQVPYRNSTALRAWTIRISRAEAVAGDLVFWPGHVGFYAGNGMVIDHGSGLGPKLRPIWGSPTYGRIPL